MVTLDGAQKWEQKQAAISPSIISPSSVRRLSTSDLPLFCEATTKGKLLSDLNPDEAIHTQEIFCEKIFQNFRLVRSRTNAFSDVAGQCDHMLELKVAQYFKKLLKKLLKKCPFQFLPNKGCYSKQLIKMPEYLGYFCNKICAQMPFKNSLI